MTYYKKDKESLVCLLCHHYCHLKPHQTGLCGVNKNTGNKIECLVYGHLSALNIDPIEKKPLYHFLPQSKSLSLGTVGCNFKCAFCQNWGISQEKKIDTSSYISASQVVELAVKHQCKSISFTYNEPTIFYPFAKDVALYAKQYNIKSVYVSNGFESKEVLHDMSGLIDAMNIDLKCFNEKYYKQLGGTLQAVCDNLKQIVNRSIWLEITTLIIPTKNDSYEELLDIATFIKEELGPYIPWHISAFHPDYKEQKLPRTSVQSLKMAYDIAKKVGLQYVYIGNANFNNHTCCKRCNHTLISRRYFNTLSNELIQNRCPNCQEVLEGVFL
jgi:AmmeMemoRadiSam system radical SAM enzyme